MLPRPLSTLALPEVVRKALKRASYRHYEDLIDQNGDCKENVAELLSRLLFNPSDLRKLVAPPLIDTACQLLQNEALIFHIPTLSQSIDNILGGGVPSSGVLQIIGGPGSGKTQFLMQICINVQLPECFGGQEGASIFLDTDLGYSTKRMREMSEGVVTHCSKIAAFHQMEEELQNFTVKSILDNVHYMHIMSHIELVAAVEQLNAFIVKNPKIKLIALDSMIFPFLTMNNTLERTRILYLIVNKMSQIAEQHNISVVFTNHLTTKVHNSSKRLVQAMGEALAHRVRQTLLLAKLNETFSAVMNKSSNLAEVVALFDITKEGVRDIEESSSKMDQSQSEMSEEDPGYIRDDEDSSVAMDHCPSEMSGENYENIHDVDKSSASMDHCPIEILKDKSEN